MPELAATVALVVRLRLATALVLRSRIRLRARARPVALSPQRLHTSSAPGCFFSRLGPLSYLGSRLCPGTPREVSESSTNSARTVVTTRSRTTVRHHRRRTRARVVSQPSASRTSALPVALRLSGQSVSSPRSSRVRQRALTRPVTDLSASVASIGPPIRRPPPPCGQFLACNAAVHIPTRIVRPRPGAYGAYDRPAPASTSIHLPMSLRARSESSGAVDASRGGVESQSMSCVLPIPAASRGWAPDGTRSRVCARDRARVEPESARVGTMRALLAPRASPRARRAVETRARGARSVEWNAPSWLERAILPASEAAVVRRGQYCDWRLDARDALEVWAYRGGW